MIKVDSKLRRKVEALPRRAEGLLLPASVLAEEGNHLAPIEAERALRDIDGDHPSLGLEARLIALAQADGGYAARRDYIARDGCAGVRRFSARGDVAIYLMPAETFPHHINNVYLVLEPGHSMIFDVGSGIESSRRDLALGFAIVRAMFGESSTSTRSGSFASRTSTKWPGPTIPSCSTSGVSGLEPPSTPVTGPPTLRFALISRALEPRTPGQA